MSCERCAELRRKNAELHTRVAELARQLNRAQSRLRNRQLIERAKGVLMKQLGVDEEAAYATMRKHSQDKNIPMAKLAENILLLANTQKGGEQ